jgi:hypothetical protein
MAGKGKRGAEVPRAVCLLAENVSKADLLEVAWSLAGLCGGGEAAEDFEPTWNRLLEELNAQRAASERKPLKLPKVIVDAVEQLRAAKGGA